MGGKLCEWLIYPTKCVKRNCSCIGIKHDQLKNKQTTSQTNKQKTHWCQTLSYITILAFITVGDPTTRMAYELGCKSIGVNSPFSRTMVFSNNRRSRISIFKVVKVLSFVLFVSYRYTGSRYPMGRAWPCMSARALQFPKQCLYTLACHITYRQEKHTV